MIVCVLEGFWSSLVSILESSCTSFYRYKVAIYDDDTFPGMTNLVHIFFGFFKWSSSSPHLIRIMENRRSYLVPTHIDTIYCQLLMQFTLNLLKIETSFLYTFIRENKYLENTVAIIKIRPIVCEHLDTRCWDKMSWN